MAKKRFVVLLLAAVLAGGTGAQEASKAAGWYAILSGANTTGPYSLADMRRLAQEGRLSGSTLVWTSSMKDWTKAADVRALDSVFAPEPAPPEPDTPEPDTPKPASPKPAAAKSDAAKPASTKSDTVKSDAVKSDTAKSDAAKPAAAAEPVEKRWLLGGSVYFRRNAWKTSANTSDYTDEFDLSLLAGRYLLSRFAAALRVTFNFYDEGSYMAIGPSFRYDLAAGDRVSLSLVGTVRYAAYQDSYSWLDTHSALDAQRIVALVSPQLGIAFSKNLEFYWEFAQLGYTYTWLTLPDTDIDCTTSSLYLSGPFSNPGFGLVFRF